MQFVVTPQAGKRLIGKALAKRLTESRAFKEGRIVIVAGTTNGYLAEELAKLMGREEAFDKGRFFRGVTVPPHVPTNEAGRLPDEASFLGDLAIVRGEWLGGKTIFELLDELREGDVVVKGANAIDLRARRGGVLVGHPKGGTIVAGITACIGRRVELIVAAGAEKRVELGMDELARMLNAPGVKGFRFMPIPGELFTELDAIKYLTGAEASIVAAGGIMGAEGAVWLHVEGSAEQVAKGRELIESVAAEPPFGG